MKDDKVIIMSAPDLPQLSPIDIAATDWSFDHGKVTGRDSGTLTASGWQFHPLKTALGVLGVLGVAREGGKEPVPAERRVLFSTLIGQASLAHAAQFAKAFADASLQSALELHDTEQTVAIGHGEQSCTTACDLVGNLA